MLKSKGYAALDAKSPLVPYSFERRAMKDHDVMIKIKFCGICHSDLHQVKNEWGGSVYPMVPGHEVVGIVEKIGSKVTKFKVGDAVGVGCLVDSCRHCPSCEEGEEQFCANQISFTYNSFEQDKVTPTFGGYSDSMLVHEDFTLKIPQGLSLEEAAPLLCAGITTYSPLKHWKVQKGHRVGIIGLGGLGHMACQYAAAFGADVTVFSSSENKKAEALKFGAHHFVTFNTTEDPGYLNELNKYDFLINAASSIAEINPYLQLLKLDGVMIMLGIPDKNLQVGAGALIMKRRKLTGSLIGGIKETQEMLDYSAKHKIVPQIEVLPIQEVNHAFDRMIKNQVRYRFVLDMQKL